MSKAEPILETPIRIFNVTGGTAEQRAALMECSFDPKAVDAYFFFDQGKEKSTSPAGHMATGKSFTFVMDGLIWTIHDFHLDLKSVPQTAHGKWRVYSTIEHIGQSHGKPGDVDEDPTFQAQSGIRVDYETAASANA